MKLLVILFSCIECYWYFYSLPLVLFFLFECLNSFWLMQDNSTCLSCSPDICCPTILKSVVQLSCVYHKMREAASLKMFMLVDHLNRKNKRWKVRWIYVPLSNEAPKSLPHSPLEIHYWNQIFRFENESTL